MTPEAKQNARYVAVAVAGVILLPVVLVGLATWIDVVFRWAGLK